MKVAPSFGTMRVIVVDAIVSLQVPEVLMVSVPPDESVHPLMVGGAEAFMVSDAGLGTLPVAVNVVHETVIGTESMSPLKVTFVPVFSFPVIVVPAGWDAKAAVVTPNTSAPVATMATIVLVSLDMVGFSFLGSLPACLMSLDMLVWASLGGCLLVLKLSRPTGTGVGRID